MSQPTSFHYQWYRDGVLISGAESKSYSPVDADIGARLTCTVTGTNAAGSTTVRTVASAVVTGVTSAGRPTAAAT